MKNYDELAAVYDTKFLNYIISRSKALSAGWNLEYEDLIQDGLLKLVEVYGKDNKAEDPFVMTSLVNFYNDVWNSQLDGAELVPLEEWKLSVRREKGENIYTS
jgi:hypothetical protein